MEVAGVTVTCQTPVEAVKRLQVPSLANLWYHEVVVRLAGGSYDVRVAPAISAKPDPAPVVLICHL